MARKIRHDTMAAAFGVLPQGIDPRASEAYKRALLEARKHHATSKTYSGKFLRPHALFLKEIIDRLDCQSLLDYGCGKGAQYEWVSHGGDASIPQDMKILEYWSSDRPIERHCNLYLYDPAWPPFERPPSPGMKFDLVICTHALGSIPLEDLGWVMQELIDRSTKALYIAEKIGPVGKQVFSEAEEMPRWTAQQWEELILARPDPGIEITLATREKRPEGVIMTRRKFGPGEFL